VDHHLVAPRDFPLQHLLGKVDAGSSNLRRFPLLHVRVDNRQFLQVTRQVKDLFVDLGNFGEALNETETSREGQIKVENR